MFTKISLTIFIATFGMSAFAMGPTLSDNIACGKHPAENHFYTSSNTLDITADSKLQERDLRQKQRATEQEMNEYKSVHWRDECSSNHQMSIIQVFLDFIPLNWCASENKPKLTRVTAYHDLCKVTDLMRGGGLLTLWGMNKEQQLLLQLIARIVINVKGQDQSGCGLFTINVHL